MSLFSMSLFSSSFYKKIFLCFILFTGVYYLAGAQTSTITIRGQVRDSATHAPIANVSVYFPGSSGVRTDSTGHYSLLASKRFVNDTHLQFVYVGYKKTAINVDFGVAHHNINVELIPDNKSLQDVVVGNTRKRYRNKDNPAVELIRQVLAHRDENRMTAYDYAQYSEYDKLVLSLSKKKKKTVDSKWLTKYRFLLDNADTTSFPGKSLVPIYLNEQTANVYYRRNPQNTKTIVTAQNSVDFGEFVDMKGLTNGMKSLYSNIDIYDNNFMLMTNQFLSPISNMAPTFYKFFLGDTVVIDGIKQVQLMFSPRNSQDMLFRGTLFVTLDGRYAVQKVKMYSPNGINVNFLRAIVVTLDFTRRPDGKYLLTKSDIVGDFGLFKKGMGLFGQRVVVYKDFETNTKIPDMIFRGSPVVIQDSATNKGETFWAGNRFDSLSYAQAKTYQNIDSLRNMKSYKHLMDWGSLLLFGYKQAGPAEIGPANAFYSFNPVEGLRLRAGGRTTTRLSNRYYFEGYGAYGFKDERWKYFGSATYSINDKSIYQFPQNYVRVSYQHETQIPGQQLQFVQEDNFLLSFKRGNNDKWLYNNFFNIDYVKEFQNHFSWDVNFMNWKQFPAGSLAFLYNNPAGGAPVSAPSVTTTEASVTLRYAPHEVFYQGKIYRSPVVNQYPVFQLKFAYGLKGLMGAQYNYQRVQANIFKRFYWSQFGYTDVTLDAGYVFGKVPYPLLLLPHANQTYAYQLNSYNLMNFIEFANDHYVSLTADHYFNGFIFNKIPLLKKLKWREVVEGKMLWGGLRDENNPYKNPSQMLFPTTNGLASTFPMTNTPYVEGGVGIANIFKFVSIYYIQRFTYLNNPDITKQGIRFMVIFNL
jgi:hypothetical protein